MTPREADKLIEARTPVTVLTRHGEMLTLTLLRRSRWTIEAAYLLDGSERCGVFERADLEIISSAGAARKR